MAPKLELELIKPKLKCRSREELILAESPSERSLRPDTSADLRFLEDIKDSVAFLAECLS